MKPIVPIASCMLLGAAAGLVATPAAAEFPEKSVVLVVPFGAGGGTDATARVFASEFGKALDTDIVVKNTTGAQGTIGANEVATAGPEGYTLGYLPVGPVTTQPHLRNVPYDIESWSFVCGVSRSPIVLTVAQDSPFDSVEDIVDAAKEDPDGLLWAAGTGSVPNLSLLGFEKTTGTEIRHLPVRDAAAGVKELMAGTVQFYADSSNIVPRFDLKPIVVFADERLPELPDVPTIGETGYEGEFAIWTGVFGPKDLAPESHETLRAACADAVESEEFKTNMEKIQAPITYMDAEEFESFARDQYATFGEILEGTTLQ